MCFGFKPYGFGAVVFRKLLAVYAVFVASVMMCTMMYGPIVVPCIPTSPVPGLAYDGCGVSGQCPRGFIVFLGSHLAHLV